MRIVCCLALLAGLCLTACARNSSDGQSQTPANVPDARSFGGFMQRDLAAYFEKTLNAEAIHVEYQLLRDGPTQTGTGFPKFYVWVMVFRGSRLLTEGAVRVAAVDGTGFTVTHFLAKDQIAAEPEEVNSIFPAALNRKILNLAAK